MTIAHQSASLRATHLFSFLSFFLFLQGCNSQLQIPLPCLALSCAFIPSPDLCSGRKTVSSPSKKAHAFGDTLISAFVTAFRPSAAQPFASSYEALNSCSRRSLSETETEMGSINKGSQTWHSTEHPQPIILPHFEPAPVRREHLHGFRKLAPPGVRFRFASRSEEDVNERTENPHGSSTPKYVEGQSERRKGARARGTWLGGQVLLLWPRKPSGRSERMRYTKPCSIISLKLLPCVFLS
jgi:hypothetical protein